MSRFIRRPRSMPRFSRGRMFNRLTGGYAPSLYSGRRPRRWAHRRFQTQTSPYGAAGGGRRQVHAGHSGHAGNVYGAMLHHARRQGGVNMGLLPSTPGYRGTRVHRGFRQGQASIRRDFQNRIRAERRNLRNAGNDRERNIIRNRIATLRGQHRVDRRQAAADWSNKRGGVGPRYGINVRQNPYTGRRFNTGFNFRRHQGVQISQLARAQNRNMRIANRMNNPMRGGIPWRRGAVDMRIHGGQGNRLMGLPATHADFTRARRWNNYQAGRQAKGMFF